MPLGTDVRGAKGQRVEQSIGIPWWAMASLVGYTAVLVWEFTIIIEFLGKRSFILIPGFLLRLSVAMLAYAYWNGPVCDWISGSLGFQTFFFILVFLVTEAAWRMHFVLVVKPFPRKYDDLMIVLSALAAIVFPGCLLYFVYQVLVAHQCAVQ